LITTRFGRIGTNGQSSSSELPDNATAQLVFDSLIAEKLKAGYVEISEAESTVEAIAQPSAEDSNPESPLSLPAILEQLAPFRTQRFKLLVASGINTPTSTLQSLAQDGNAEVRRAALLPRNSSPLVLPVPSLGESGVTLVSEPSTTSEVLVGLSSGNLGLRARRTLLARVDCPAQALTNLALDGGGGASFVEDPDGFSERLAVAQHPNTPPEAWWHLALLEGEGPIPISLLDDLSAHPRKHVRLAVASRPELQGNSREILKQDSHRSIREVARKFEFTHAEPTRILWATHLQSFSSWRQQQTLLWRSRKSAQSLVIVAMHRKNRFEVVVAAPPGRIFQSTRRDERGDGVWRVREEFRDESSAISAAQRIASSPSLFMTLAQDNGSSPLVMRWTDESDVESLLDGMRTSQVVEGSLDGGVGSFGKMRNRSIIDLALVQAGAQVAASPTMTSAEAETLAYVVRNTRLSTGYWGPFKAIFKARPTDEIWGLGLARIEYLGYTDEYGDEVDEEWLDDQEDEDSTTEAIERPDLYWLRPALTNNRHVRFPSPRTRAYLLRTSLRELLDLAGSDPARFIEVATTILTFHPDETDYEQLPVSWMLLFGNSESRPNYIDLRTAPVTPMVRARRNEIAGDLWDQNLEAVQRIWNATRSNTVLMTWALEVLLANESEPVLWNYEQILTFLSSEDSRFSSLASQNLLTTPEVFLKSSWDEFLRLTLEQAGIRSVDPDVMSAIRKRFLEVREEDQHDFLINVLVRDHQVRTADGPLANMCWSHINVMQRDHIVEFLEEISQEIDADDILVQLISVTQGFDSIQDALVERMFTTLERMIDIADDVLGGAFWTQTLSPELTMALDEILSNSPRALGLLWQACGQVNDQSARLVDTLSSLPATMKSLVNRATQMRLQDTRAGQWNVLYEGLKDSETLESLDAQSLLSLAINSSGALQALLIETIEKLDVMDRSWLPLLESQSQPGVDAARRFLVSQSESEEFTDLILASIDSGIPAAREVGLSLLGDYYSVIDLDRVYVSLTQHRYGDVTAVVAARALAPGISDAAALWQFDRRVLLQRSGQDVAKRLIQKRWYELAIDSSEAMNSPREEMVELLLQLTQHVVVRDQEWAYQMLSVLGEGFDLSQVKVSRVSGAG